MRTQMVPWILAAVAGCVVLGGCGGLYAIWLTIAINDRGSPELAMEWRAILQAAPGPEEAVAADPEVVVLRFPNGEWVFGKSQNSHGCWRRGGGTLVVRDSRGRVRAFFGHICGPRYMQDAYGRDNPSLDAFYGRVLEYNKIEYTFPDAGEPDAPPNRPHD
jgi:hypothetical protein